MSEIRDVRKHGNWYGSYIEDPQGRSLIKCMVDRIKEDDSLFETLLREIELCENPKEFDEALVLNSIKLLIENRAEVKSKDGYFGWVC